MSETPDAAAPLSQAAAIDQARILMQALPHMLHYDNATVVVKYGGHAMGDEATARDFARDMVLLETSGINPVVVHGGGPQIGAMLKKLGIKSEFADGLRVTDKATAEIAEMVLSGSINKEIVGWIAKAGGKAMGISGKDGNMVTARKVTRTIVDPDSKIEEVLDLGFVGEPVAVDPTILTNLASDNFIPVVAPVALGADGETYNINADTMAGAIAGALGAKRFFLLTDVAGVLDKSGALLTDLDRVAIDALKADATITGGMIPKVETCVAAVDAGVEAAVILDGRIPHAMLLEIFTARGAGTLIHR